MAIIYGATTAKDVEPGQGDVRWFLRILGVCYGAKEFLERLGFSTLASAEGHAAIVRDLQCCGNPDALAVGGLLRDLRTEQITRPERAWSTALELGYQLRSQCSAIHFGQFG